ncbi:MAG: hypothetical protein SFW67_02050 [Myxococcaceae bacterium]|nr:hypothetical protein [Myxococcaceae bacterium]
MATTTPARVIGSVTFQRSSGPALLLPLTGFSFEVEAVVATGGSGGAGAARPVLKPFMVAVVPDGGVAGLASVANYTAASTPTFTTVTVSLANPDGGTPVPFATLTNAAGTSLDVVPRSTPTEPQRVLLALSPQVVSFSAGATTVTYDAALNTTPARCPVGSAASGDWVQAVAASQPPALPGVRDLVVRQFELSGAWNTVPSGGGAAMSSTFSGTVHATLPVGAPSLICLFGDVTTGQRYQTFRARTLGPTGTPDLTISSTLGFVSRFSLATPNGVPTAEVSMDLGNHQLGDLP